MTLNRLFLALDGSKKAATALKRVERVDSALIDERARIAAIKASGAVPVQCGDAIPVAPARGPVRAVQTTALYPKGADQYEAKPAGFMGRSALQRADVFDVMLHRARLAGRAPWLRPDQIAIARHYRDLIERHEAGGVRCSSLESMPSGSGGNGDGFTDARLAAAGQIERLQRRIGGSVAMVVRRIRPSDRGSRVAITDRALVDMTALHDKSIAEILKAHAWDDNGKTIGALKLALSDALDRMIGPVQKAKGSAVHYGARPAMVIDDGA